MTRWVYALGFILVLVVSSGCAYGGQTQEADHTEQVTVTAFAWQRQAQEQEWQVVQAREPYLCGFVTSAIICTREVSGEDWVNTTLNSSYGYDHAPYWIQNNPQARIFSVFELYQVEVERHDGTKLPVSVSYDQWVTLEIGMTITAVFEGDSIASLR